MSGSCFVGAVKVPGLLTQFLVLAVLLGALAVVLAVVVSLAMALDRRGVHLRGRPNPPASAFAPAKGWTLTLLVDVDVRHRLLRPSVQLHGDALERATSLRIELADARTVHATMARVLPTSAVGTEVPFPPFALPPGRTAESVLGWCWHLVLEADGRELARWHEHPKPMDGIDAEGEIGMQDTFQ